MQVRTLSVIIFFLIVTIPLGTASSSYDDLVKEGDTFFVDGDYQKALDSYDSAIQIEKTQADIYEKKALALFNLNRFREALMAVNRSLEIDEDSSSAKSLKEEINQKLGIDEEPASPSDAANSASEDDSEDSGSLSSGVIVGNTDDFVTTQLQPIIVVGGNEKYRTYVPAQYDCEEKDNGIWACSSDQTLITYIIYMEDTQQVIKPQEEEEFLKERLENRMGEQNFTVENGFYNDEYHFYRMEGHDLIKPDVYIVKVFRFIEDRIASFSFVYPNQESSDGDRIIQDLIIEELEPYGNDEDERVPGVVTQTSSPQDETSCCDDKTLSAGYRKNICGCPVSEEEYTEWQKNPTG